MSRIGNAPIAVVDGVTATVASGRVTVKGAKGESTLDLPSAISVEIKDGSITVARKSDAKFVRSLHGTMRSLIANMILGVSQGYTKELEIHGVGFRAQLQGNKLVMQVGYSHPIEFVAPEGITLTVPEQTVIIITGVDKQLVGQVAARLRAYCPVEPYKGKGIRYKGEHVRRKVGKAVA